MILLQYQTKGLNEFGDEIEPTVFDKNVKLKELAKHNCRRCHGRGQLSYDFPRRWEKTEVCSCVENSLLRRENKKRIERGESRMKTDEEVTFLASFNKQ